MIKIKSESVGYKIFRAIFLIFVILLFLFPIYWMVRTSLAPRTETIMFPVRYFPKTIEFTGYIRAIKESNGIAFFTNTVQVNVLAAILALVLGIPAAYAVSRFKFWGKESGFMFTALSARFLPPATALVPLYFLYAKFGLIDSKLGLVIAYAALNLPIVLWVMRSFIDEIPIVLEESYMLDGHSRLATFFKIVIPLSTPGIAAMFMICNFLTWGEFLLTAILTTTTNSQTIPVGVANLEGDIGILWQQISAFGVLASIPIILIIVFFQRYLVRGFSFGILK